MTNFELIRYRLESRAGLLEPPKAKFSLKVLARTEWSDLFEKLMRNRLIMGALRYGLLHAPGKPQYDRIASMIKRLRIYEETGNKERLVDVANLCLLEFEECNHPKAHFSSEDDTDVHVAVKGATATGSGGNFDWSCAAKWSHWLLWSNVRQSWMVSEDKPIIQDSAYPPYEKVWSSNGGFSEVPAKYAPPKPTVAWEETLIERPKGL